MQKERSHTKPVAESIPRPFYKANLTASAVQSDLILCFCASHTTCSLCCPIHATSRPSVSPFLSFPILQGPSPISLFSIDHVAFLGENTSVISNTKVSQESRAGKCLLPSRISGMSPAGSVACPQVLWGPGAWLLPVPSWCWQETEVWASREQTAAATSH